MKKTENVISINGLISTNEATLVAIETGQTANHLYRKIRGGKFRPHEARAVLPYAQKNVARLNAELEKLKALAAQPDPETQPA